MPQRQLAREEQIRIGDCVYVFEYLDFVESEAHEQQLAMFMKQTNGPNWEGIPQLLTSSSEATPMRLHHYTWSLGAFARGSFGQVTAGTASDGTPVAVKRLNKPREKQLSVHRKMMSYIGKHANIVELIDCYAGPDANIPEAYCIYQPLAATSLYDVMGQKELPLTTQVTLFRQYLEGLAFLHDEKGVMHRDIKPPNLGIVTWNPPVGVIFDLDSATREEISTDHSQGTLGFLAPEVVALKQWHTGRIHDAVRASLPCPLPPYGRKVDIWALGLSAYTTYTGAITTDEYITRALYQMIRQDLEREIQLDNGAVRVSVAKIILQMLCWNASERLSTAKALEGVQGIEKQMDGDAGMDVPVPGMKRPHVGAPHSAYREPLEQRKPRIFQ